MTPARENERPAEIRGVSFTIRGNDPFASQISSRNDPIAEIAITLVQPSCFRRHAGARVDMKFG